MKHRNAPRIATWLLNRLSGCDEALVGDMVEEYRRGRSRLWYWRQTSIAVLRTTVADVRSHPVLALRAFVLMVLCVLCYEFCLLQPFSILTRDLIWKLNPRLLHPGHSTLFTFSYLFLVLEVLAPCIGYVLAAQIVARFHRPHQAVFTLVNAMLVLFVGALQLVWLIERNPHGYLPRFPSYVYFRIELLLLFVVSTLVGGLWEREKHTRAAGLIDKPSH